MEVMQGLQYTKDHEWVKLSGTRATIGITDFAQHSLGDIVYVDLPQEGNSLKAGGVLGTVESVKTVSDVYTPFAGKVVEVNSELEDSPERLNSDPYDSWLAVLELEDGASADGLLDAGQYEELCAGEE